MKIQFATCIRSKALEYIRKVCPSKIIDEKDLKDFLDFVEKDVVRVQDPLMYGKMIGIIPGKNWNDSLKDTVIKSLRFLND